jgi:endo-1,3(4)-beta-glucanase
MVQVAKIKNDGEEKTYDQQAGTYATTCEVTADATGDYTLSWSKKGDKSKTLLMFALPHHIGSFQSDTKAKVLGIQLQTPTKGNATLVQSDWWNLSEQLPTSMGFAPWSPTVQTAQSLSANAKQIIGTTLKDEFEQDMITQTNLSSLYFSGKALAKFASMIYTAQDLVQHVDLAGTALLRHEQVEFNKKNQVLKKAQKQRESEYRRRQREITKASQKPKNPVVSTRLSSFQNDF